MSSLLPKKKLPRRFLQAGLLLLLLGIVSLLFINFTSLGRLICYRLWCRSKTRSFYQHADKDIFLLGDINAPFKSSIPSSLPSDSNLIRFFFGSNIDPGFIINLQYKEAYLENLKIVPVFDLVNNEVVTVSDLINKNRDWSNLELVGIELWDKVATAPIHVCLRTSHPLPGAMDYWGNLERWIY
jgi:hypothetical protein